VCTATPNCGQCPVRDGCEGPTATPPRRRQPRFEGSLRQRRGRLLRQVIAGARIPITKADDEAAAGLVADGLAAVSDGRLTTPD
jgi:A/G-specific adenine glycosylase